MLPNLDFVNFLAMTDHFVEFQPTIDEELKAARQLSGSVVAVEPVPIIAVPGHLAVSRLAVGSLETARSGPVVIIITFVQEATESSFETDRVVMKVVTLVITTFTRLVASLVKGTIAEPCAQSTGFGVESPKTLCYRLQPWLQLWLKLTPWFWLGPRQLQLLLLKGSCIVELGSSRPSIYFFLSFYIKFGIL